MRASGMVFGCAAVAALTSAMALAADVPAFTPKVTDVAVFKDGHALIAARGKASLRDGWCRTDDVPVPVLGTFWAFTQDEAERVDFIKAGFVEAKRARPCLNIYEMLQVNQGKRVRLIEQTGKGEDRTHEGTLLGILRHEPERSAASSATPSVAHSGFSLHGRRPSAASVQPGAAAQLASFVMVRADDGVHLVNRDGIRSIVLTDGAPVTDYAEMRKVPQIQMHLTADGRPGDRECPVGLVYLQKGIRWIPGYRVELLDDARARVSLQATLINDIVDLTDANVRLVVGVPNFLFKDHLSPMALREQPVPLSHYFNPPARGNASHRGRRGELAMSMSNVLISQVAGADRGQQAAAAAGPDLPGEGRMEELFLYRKSGVTLKKGERAIVQLLRRTVGYEDIYTWKVPPFPPKALWQNANQQHQQELMAALSEAKAWHEVRLANPGPEPWTTGPATLFKDKAPLGQHLLTYTSAGNKVDVRMTVAPDINTTKTEVELSREDRLRIDGHNYIKVRMRGTLKAANFKDKPVRLRVSRLVFGTVTCTTPEGKVQQSNLLEDRTALAGARSWWGSSHPWWWGYYPWWWWGVNTFSEITWEVTVQAGNTATFEYDWHYLQRH